MKIFKISYDVDIKGYAQDRHVIIIKAESAEIALEKFYKYIDKTLRVDESLLKNACSPSVVEIESDILFSTREVV